MRCQICCSFFVFVFVLCIDVGINIGCSCKAEVNGLCPHAKCEMWHFFWIFVLLNYSDEVLGSTPNLGKKERLKFFWGCVRMVEVT